MTQNQQILSHLKNRGAITQREAIELYGIYRLAARIAELRDNPKIQIKTVLHRTGKTGHYARYHLQEQFELF